MPIDPDETPPEGIEETPTSPDLASGLRCPSCRGERFEVHVVEKNPDGTVAKALASPCRDCRGAGSVDRQTFTRLRAVREGRPR